jgi:hypothetical protein
MSAAALALAFALPVGVAGVALAGCCVIRLIRTVQRSFVCRFPVAATSRVTIDEAGAFVINIETPQLSLADIGMGALTMKGTAREVDSGAEVPLRPDVTGMSVTGVATTRRAVFRFRAPRPGAYELSISGIPDREALARCSFVLSRPLGLAIVPLILGIILGMAALILAIVLPLALSGANDPLAAGGCASRRRAGRQPAVAVGMGGQEKGGDRAAVRYSVPVCSP